ncbi:hypothetical protein D9M68_764890 [compost metagenome]
MKNITLLLITACIFLLAGCSGSDVYRGAWKATDASGHRFELFFEEKDFTVKDSTGKVTSFSYTQNQVSIQNSVETYGIQLKDGRSYKINFPIKDNEKVGLILDQNGSPMYTISRTGYMKYEEIFTLQ